MPPAKGKSRAPKSAPARPGRKLPHPQPFDALVYPRFTGVPTFMRLPHIADPAELDIAMIGIPYDGGATYRPGTRFGPRNVRVQSALIRPWNPVLNLDPFSEHRIGDLGDFSVNPLSIDDTYARIEQQMDAVLAAGAKPVSVGGDHSILLPILRAVAKRHGPLAFLQFDAHGDTWPGYFGCAHSHGTPVKHAVDEGLIAPGCALQVGLRGQVYDSSDFDFARQHKMGMISSEEFHAGGVKLLRPFLKKIGRRPLYITFDIDVVDPAFAPGTGTPQVGGVSSAQAVEMVRACVGKNLVGCDLVEVSPPYDSSEITSLLAANLLFEMLCLFPR